MTTTNGRARRSRPARCCRCRRCWSGCTGGLPGQVLDLELEHEQGRWIYEIKLLQPDGQLLKLEVDARTAQVLQVKRKDDRKARYRPQP